MYIFTGNIPMCAMCAEVFPRKSELIVLFRYDGNVIAYLAYIFSKK